VTHVRPEYDEEGTLRAVDIDIQLPPAFPEKYREALERVVEQCSVKRAIRAQPNFRVHAGLGEQTKAQKIVV